MEQGDHTDCPVELRDCAEHKDAQERPTPEVESDAVEIDFSILSEERQAARPHCECGCADLAPGTGVGFCLWCGHVYAEYSRLNQAKHFAYDCPGAPEKLKAMERESLARHRT
jgi:hypothetical protein